MFKVLHVVTYTVYFIMEGNFLVISWLQKNRKLYMNFDKKANFSFTIVHFSFTIFQETESVKCFFI